MNFARELFRFEMILRKALSLMYLNAFASGYYDLLRKDKVILAGKKLKEEEMEPTRENQFFHMGFSQYAKLNKRRQIEPKDIADALQNAANFDAFKAEVLRTPVTDDLDKSLIFSLEEAMESIESLRNCIMHNRTPAPELVENYLNAKRTLLRDADARDEQGKIEEFLQTFSISENE